MSEQPDDKNGEHTTTSAADLFLVDLSENRLHLQSFSLSYVHIYICNYPQSIPTTDDENQLEQNVELGSDEMVLSAQSLHKSPYKTRQDQLLARISIKNRCYGNDLDRIIELTKELGAEAITTSSRTLMNLEKDALPEGLHFIEQTIDVPMIPNISAWLQSILYPNKIVIRKDISVAVVEMLTRPSVWSKLVWRWQQRKNDKGCRVYEGFYSGTVWQQQQLQVGELSDLAGVLLFSDSTQILRFTNKDLHPIYMCPAGLEYSDMGLHCMTLLGFVPKLPGHLKDKMSEKERKTTAMWTRLLLSTIYAHITRSIHRFSKCGIQIRLAGGRLQRIHPFVVTVISDHCEGNDIALLDLLSCRYCDMTSDKYAGQDNVGNKRSFPQHHLPLHPLMDSVMHPLDPFTTAHCILHDVDEGIWRWIVNTLLLPLFSSPVEQEQMAEELSHLTRVPELQKWPTFTESSTHHLNARQMRQLLVQMVVVLGAWIFRKPLQEKVFMLVLVLCQWYALVRSRETTEDDLDRIAAYSVTLRETLREAIKANGMKYNTTAVKHHVILHYADLVRAYGALLYQSTEMWDSAHKHMIKAHLVSHGSTNFQQTVEHRVEFFVRQQTLYHSRVAQ